MKSILGYTDRLTARPGETLDVKISSRDNLPFDAQLVRLIATDTQSDQPRFEVEAIDAPVNGHHQGSEQQTSVGSYVVVDHPLETGQGFTLVVNFMATAGHLGQQHIVSRWNERTKSGWTLGLNQDGALTFSAETDSTKTVHSLTAVLDPAQWYQAVLSVDGEQQQVDLSLSTIVNSSIDLRAGETVQLSEPMGISIPVEDPDVPLLFAAGFNGRNHCGSVIGSGVFNGRIERPVMYSGILSDVLTARVCTGDRPSELAPRLLGDWDFSVGMDTTRVLDRSPHQRHGLTRNLPMRAAKGSRWHGAMNASDAPEQFSAIHFHANDLYDSEWETTLTLTLPDHLKSAIYALHVTQDGSNGEDEYEDYIPFFVAAPKCSPQSQLAFLVPTFSYLAYGNMRFIEEGRKMMQLSRDEYYAGNAIGPGGQYYACLVEDHPEVGGSIYDTHADGTPITHSSWLRPMLSIRPKSQLLSFGADMLMIDWLERQGIDYDIITDDLLQTEGVELLSDYRVVMSGNHPEYPTTQMLDAIEAYLADGGRFMYMGGNGFYWRTAVHPTLPGVIEVRRGRTGSGTSKSEVGESYLSFTGEKGGIWRDIGRPPQRLFGVGTIGLASGGGESASYYRIVKEAKDSRAAFAFDGIDDEIIGDYGILEGAAAGQEIDQANPTLGTPEHAIVLARSENHGPGMVYAIEEMQSLRPIWEMYRDQTYSDVVFFETPNGGAVFSVGSMTWCGSLSHNGGENGVSKLTRNVIQRFLIGEPFTLA